MRCTTTWLLVAAWATVGGCSSSSGPQTPPALLNVFWIASGHRTAVWTNTEPDAGTTLAPPAVQQVDFVFDQRLNGTKVENASAPAIGVSWPEQTAGAAFPATVLYNSEPFYGGGSSYAFLRPASVGLPSGDAITFTLDPALLTGANGQPFTGPTQIIVMTGPLTATVRVPSDADAGGVVPAGYMMPIVFSNRVATDTVTPFIHAATPAGPLPVTVVANASDPTIAYVTAACAGGWPPGVPVTLTIDAGAPDAFGRLLAAPASGTFTAVSAGGQSPDGGC
ncbi:MAG TPA: hypothetical protein VHM31_04485 [Polyangia bacterium]|nr:hypothetical protein [Polyangia bacterium]